MVNVENSAFHEGSGAGKTDPPWGPHQKECLENFLENVEQICQGNVGGRSPRKKRRTGNLRESIRDCSYAFRWSRGTIGRFKTFAGYWESQPSSSTLPTDNLGTLSPIPSLDTVQVNSRSQHK